MTEKDKKKELFRNLSALRAGVYKTGTLVDELYEMSRLALLDAEQENKTLQAELDAYMAREEILREALKKVMAETEKPSTDKGVLLLTIGHLNKIAQEAIDRS